MTRVWAIHHHLPPPPGAPQPLRPKPTGGLGGYRPSGVDPADHRRRQGGGGSGFVTVNQRLFAPLQGINPNSPLMGGYGWLSVTDNGATYHPG